MSIKNQLVQAVSNIRTEHMPYDHFYMDTVFELDTYKKLLTSLPARSSYEQFLHPDAKVSEYESTRLRFPLTTENLNKVPAGTVDFWNEVIDATKSKELTEVVFSKLADDLKMRFKLPLSKIPASPHPFLFKDITGYKISPHADTPKKAVTFQLYLPEDDSNTDVGTIVYTHEGNKQFKKLKQFRFAPNTGYGFAVTKNSWHGVEPIGKPGLERNTLMIIWYLDVDHKKFGY